MKELFNMKGIISTVITPFTQDNKLDISSLKREIQAGVDAKVAGFLVPCVASELTSLSLEERRQMTKATVEVAKGKALIIGGVTSPSREERLALCKEFMEMGCDGVNISVPYVSDDDFRSVIAELDALHPPFLMIQDEDKVGYGLREDLIVSLFNEFESFRCIKIEVVGCGPKYSALLKATNGRINVSGGWGSDQLIEALDRGMHALMPSGLFQLFTGVYRLYYSAGREAAKRLFYDMLPIITFTRQHGTVNRQFHKRYFKQMGIFETDLMREAVLFDEYHEKYADEMIARARELISRLDEYEK